MMKIPAIVVEGESVPDGRTAYCRRALIEMPHGVDSGQDATDGAGIRLACLKVTNLRFPCSTGRILIN